MSNNESLHIPIKMIYQVHLKKYDLLRKTTFGTYFPSNSKSADVGSWSSYHRNVNFIIASTSYINTHALGNITLAA